MRTKLTLKETLLVASMLFGMLFGAGNLIFPVHMGQMAGENSLVAVCGFIITAVGFPLLGVVALSLTKTNDMYELASFVGHPYNTILTIALYLTIGPFFAIPRCASTSFTIGLSPLIPDNFQNIGLFIFSLIFFILVYIFSVRPTKILDYIGKYINPFFLIFFFILLVVAFFNPISNLHDITADGDYGNIPFFKGLLEGYNTMDAIATLAFGITVIEVIKNLGIKKPEDIAINSIKAGIFASILMAIIYIASTVVGAQSRGAFSISENGGIALSDIAGYYFNDIGIYLLLIIVTLACLKTSIGLVSSCASMFQRLFPKTLSEKQYALLFTILSFIIANFGLTTIISYSIPVLMFLYPLTISLVLLSIFGKCFGYKKQVFKIVTAFNLVAAFFDFVNALPSNVVENLHLDGLIHFAHFIPLFDLGLGWLVPTIVGLIIALVYCYYFVEDEHTETY